MISILITDSPRLSEHIKLFARDMGHHAFDSYHARDGCELGIVVVSCDENQFAQIRARAERAMANIAAGRTCEPH
jgi:hypothetical protein